MRATRLEILTALEHAVRFLATSKSRGAKDTLAELAEFHGPALDASTEHGRLCSAHREAAPPSTLDLATFLACVDANDLTADELHEGYRPCIADAGKGGPRYCYMNPGGRLHMGPPVPR